MNIFIRQANEVNSSEVKEKLAKFANSKSISSDDYYGIKKKPEEENGGDNGIEKAKEIGIALFESAKDKAKGV